MHPPCCWPARPSAHRSSSATTWPSLRTNWPTSGSATWSRWPGGTTCGSTRASRPGWATRSPTRCSPPGAGTPACSGPAQRPCAPTAWPPPAASSSRCCRTRTWATCGMPSPTRRARRCWPCSRPGSGPTPSRPVCAATCSAMPGAWPPAPISSVRWATPTPPCPMRCAASRARAASRGWRSRCSATVGRRGCSWRNHGCCRWARRRCRPSAGSCRCRCARRPAPAGC